MLGVSRDNTNLVSVLANAYQRKAAKSLQDALEQYHVQLGQYLERCRHDVDVARISLFLGRRQWQERITFNYELLESIDCLLIQNIGEDNIDLKVGMEEILRQEEEWYDQDMSRLETGVTIQIARVQEAETSLATTKELLKKRKKELGLDC